MNCLSKASIGVAPRIMGIGPAYAIPLALKNAGLELSDVDLFEVQLPFAGHVCRVLTLRFI